MLTKPLPAVCSMSSARSPSRSQGVAPAASGPVTTSTFRAPPSAATEDSTVEPVTCIGTSVAGRPANVLCHDPPAPRRSVPPCVT